MAKGGGTNLGTAYVSIVPLMEGAASKIESALGGAGGSAGASAGEAAGSMFSDRLSSALRMSGDMIAGALTSAASAAASGFADVFVGAFDAAAEYEQLEDGMKKLFGEASATVMENAAMAYKTAGMSANDYMSTVTSISASLVSSLGGDTQRAAEVADVAMRALSDNVNTFGTDIDSVSYAVMGLARNNYSMIDNLSLGYAGCAEGMMELINDSGVLGYELTDVSQLAEVGFADMVLAIQAVQEQTGIAETTSREAAGTMQGSLSMLSAAWDNVLTGIGNGEVVASGAIDALAESVVAVANNAIPLVGNIVGQVGAMLPALAEELVPQLVGLVSQLAETLAVAIPQLAAGVAAAIAEALPAVIEAASVMFGGLLEALPPVIDSLLEALPSIVDAIVDFFVDNISAMVTASIELFFGMLEAVPAVIQALVPRIPDIVRSVCGALTDNIPVLVSAATELFMAMLDCIPAIVSALFDCGPQIVQGLIDGLWSMAGALWDAVTGIFGGVVDMVMGIFGIHSPSTVLHFVGEMDMAGIAGGIEDNAELPRSAMEDAMAGVRQAASLPGYAPSYASALPAGGTTYNVNFGSLNYGSVDGSTTLEELVGGAMRYMRMGVLV